MTSGQRVRCASALLTEPSTSPAKLPPPREPTTSRSASPARSGDARRVALDGERLDVEPVGGEVAHRGGGELLRAPLRLLPEVGRGDEGGPDELERGRLPRADDAQRLPAQPRLLGRERERALRRGRAV